MLETYVRSYYQSLLVNPLAKGIANYCTAQQITFCALLSGIAVFPALLLHHPILASILLLLSGYLDTLDGTVARFSEKTSPYGAVLDIVSDRIVEFSIILGLFFIDTAHRGLFALLILGSCYICVTSFLMVGVFTPNTSNKSFHYSSGLIERAEAFLFFLAMIWFPSYFALLAISFTILVLLTSLIRVRQFNRACAQHARNTKT